MAGIKAKMWCLFWKYSWRSTAKAFVDLEKAYDSLQDGRTVLYKSGMAEKFVWVVHGMHESSNIKALFLDIDDLV